jgi:UDP-2-acetamido-3-amino-2,3-dideoxy-glucuronate N-acetyltransferase
MHEAQVIPKANVCSHTGLTIPECHCPRCYEAMLARHANGSGGIREVVDVPNPRTAPGPPAAPYRLLTDVDIGPGAQIAPFTNLYGCRIGAESRIGPFVEIQRGASVGARCKIQSHTFICEGVEIHDEVFVGHGVMFVDDKQPRATNVSGDLQHGGDWQPPRTVVAQGAYVGSGAVVIGGVHVGAGAVVGACAVVTRDVPPRANVVGVPARFVAGHRWSAAKPHVA